MTNDFDTICRTRGIGDVGDLCETLGVNEQGRQLLASMAWYLARQAFGGMMPLQALWAALDDDARAELVRLLEEEHHAET